jgi:hypothetical protein
MLISIITFSLNAAAAVAFGLNTLEVLTAKTISFLSLKVYKSVMSAALPVDGAST